MRSRRAKREQILRVAAFHLDLTALLKRILYEIHCEPYGSYYAVHDEHLIGYFCFGKSAQVPSGNIIQAYSDHNFMDVGLGIKPDLCGRGLGNDFVKFGLKFASSIFATTKFRLTVASFNKRAISVYTKVGFQYCNVSFSSNSNSKQTEFIVMLLEETTTLAMAY